MKNGFVLNVSGVLVYESTDQLLVVDYYEIMRFEAACFQDHDCSDEVIRYDGVVSNLKSTLN